MSKETSLQKREAQAPHGEWTTERKIFLPRADIYETPEAIVVLADMPGVDEKNIDITLEKNVLTITGKVEQFKPEGYELAYAEYDIGDYQRSFTLSNEIDQNEIEAVMKNGVLKLTLPKAAPARARKITVKSE
jgi:HSP20 family protein